VQSELDEARSKLQLERGDNEVSLSIQTAARTAAEEKVAALEKDSSRLLLLALETDSAADKLRCELEV